MRDTEAVPEDVIHDFDDEYREVWWGEPLDMFVIVMILRDEGCNYEEQMHRYPHDYLDWPDYMSSIYGTAFSTWEKYKKMLARRCDCPRRGRCRSLGAVMR